MISAGGESEETLPYWFHEITLGLQLMHKKGTPKNTQDKSPDRSRCHFEIKTYLTNQIKQARDAGSKTIMIDPGIGFGKTLDHNLTLSYDN